MIQVPDTRIALADLAACFYNNPSQHMHLIGITGTNGKTTVAYLIESILLKAGFKVGVIGTINYRYAEQSISQSDDNPGIPGSSENSIGNAAGGRYPCRDGGVLPCHGSIPN